MRAYVYLARFMKSLLHNFRHQYETILWPSIYFLWMLMQSSYKGNYFRNVLLTYKYGIADVPLFTW
jgi:hypothetical protein